jgi:hypothetical protein
MVALAMPPSRLESEIESMKASMALRVLPMVENVGCRFVGELDLVVDVDLVERCAGDLVITGQQNQCRHNYIARGVHGVARMQAVKWAFTMSCEEPGERIAPLNLKRQYILDSEFIKSGNLTLRSHGDSVSHMAIADERGAAVCCL